MKRAHAPKDPLPGQVFNAACHAGDAGRAAELVDAIPDPCASLPDIVRDGAWDTPVMAAVRAGFDGLAIGMFDRVPAEHLRGVLDGAALLGRVAIIRDLLGRGLPVDGPVVAHGCRGPGWSSPLGWAAKGWSSSAMRVLLDAGADPNRPGVDGATPLLTTVLVDRINERGRDGRPPVRGSMDDGVACIRMLAEAGADLETIDRGLRRTPLAIALGQRDPPHPLAAALLDAGASVPAWDLRLRAVPTVAGWRGSCLPALAAIDSGRPFQPPEPPPTPADAVWLALQYGARTTLPGALAGFAALSPHLPPAPLDPA